MQTIPTVGVLIFKDDKVLMVRHGEKASHLTGSYGIPAGRLETDETTLQAAIRELEEETGLVTTQNDLEELPLTIPPADILRKDGTTKRFKITVFLCRKYSGKLQATEETTPEWVKITDIAHFPLIGHTKQMVEEGKKFL
ncbi:MAG: NUDIX domain-containing protein [Patescibacteria group bacterium]